MSSSRVGPIDLTKAANKAGGRRSREQGQPRRTCRGQGFTGLRNRGRTDSVKWKCRRQLRWGRFDSRLRRGLNGGSEVQG
jgi:hypothetical protein